MAYTTINKHTDYFNTVTYTGNTTDDRTISGVGFQPDWNWTKNRSASQDHWLADAVRGSTKIIRSNGTNIETTAPSNGSISSFNSDGYVLQAGSSGDLNYNTENNNYVSWNWKAGTTGTGYTTGSGTSNSYSYSVNTTAGFSIINYVGNGTAGHTIPHHLGATPSMIIVKNRDRSTSAQWSVYHKNSFTSQSAPGVLYLNLTTAKSNDTNVWGNSTVTIDSTVFSVGDYEGTNQTNDNIIAYCFAEKTGYSKFGTYTGNGNADGTFIYTGFKPAWVMIKRTNSTSNWSILDNKRLGFNSAVSPRELYANANDQEYDSNRFDIISNGFKLRTSGGDGNASGGTYIYMAFGQSLVGSNNVPCTAR